jgi:type I secretion system LssB family ATPase
MQNPNVPSEPNRQDETLNAQAALDALDQAVNEPTLDRTSLNEAFGWLLAYFKVDQTLSHAPSASETEDDQVMISEVSRIAQQQGLHALVKSTDILKQPDHLQHALPCMISDGAILLIITEQTSGHWRTYDVSMRRDRYLSNDDLENIQPSLAISCEAMLEDQNALEADDQPGLKQNWIFKEIVRHKGIYRDALIASVVINSVALLTPLYTMNVYDKVVPNLAFDTLWFLTGIVFIAFLFDWVLKGARTMLTDKVGREIDIILSTKILARIMASRSEYTPNSVGNFSKSFQDFEGVRDFLNSATIAAFVDLPFTILFLLVIGLIAGPLVIAPVVVMALILATSLSTRERVMHMVKDVSEAKSKRSSLSYEILQNLDEVKSNSAKQWYLERWKQSVSEVSDLSFKNSRFTQRIQNTSQLFQQMMTAAIIVSGVYLISIGELSMGAMIAVTMISGRTVGSIMQISTLITRYEQCKEGINSINELLKIPLEREQSQVKSTRKNYHGNLVLDDVSFTYPNCEVPSLRHLNLQIKSGEKVALLGSIGSGKTTLIKILQGLYSSSEGRVLFDNLDSKYWDADILRSQISSCSQHPRLFKGTIYDNITIGQPPNMPEHHLMHAIQSSGLGDVLNDIEGGLDKSLGESNQGLSGGQTQSVALSRALARNPKLLILDEPTSMMDRVTEAKVIKSLQELPQTTTLVMSTHNLNLLSVVDRVIILERGAIKYDGSVDALKKQGVKQ